MATAAGGRGVRLDRVQVWTDPDSGELVLTCDDPDLAKGVILGVKPGAGEQRLGDLLAAFGKPDGRD